MADQRPFCPPMAWEGLSDASVRGPGAAGSRRAWSADPGGLAPLAEEWALPTPPAIVQCRLVANAIHVAWTPAAGDAPPYLVELRSVAWSTALRATVSEPFVCFHLRDAAALSPSVRVGTASGAAVCWSRWAPVEAEGVGDAPHRAEEPPHERLPLPSVRGDGGGGRLHGAESERTAPQRARGGASRPRKAEAWEVVDQLMAGLAAEQAQLREAEAAESRALAESTRREAEARRQARLAERKEVERRRAAAEASSRRTREREQKQAEQREAAREAAVARGVARRAAMARQAEGVVGEVRRQDAERRAARREQASARRQVEMQRPAAAKEGRPGEGERRGVEAAVGGAARQEKSLGLHAPGTEEASMTEEQRTQQAHEKMVRLRRDVEARLRRAADGREGSVPAVRVAAPPRDEAGEEGEAAAEAQRRAAEERKARWAEEMRLHEEARLLNIEQRTARIEKARLRREELRLEEEARRGELRRREAARVEEARVRREQSERAEAERRRVEERRAAVDERELQGAVVAPVVGNVAMSHRRRRREEKVQQAAAVTLGAAVRRLLAVRVLWSMRGEREDARRRGATTLQAQARRRAAVRVCVEARRQKAAAVCVQAAARRGSARRRAAEERRRGAARREAARAIQCGARGLAARVEARARREEREAESTVRLAEERETVEGEGGGYEEVEARGEVEQIAEEQIAVAREMVDEESSNYEVLGAHGEVEQMTEEQMAEEQMAEEREQFEGEGHAYEEEVAHVEVEQITEDQFIEDQEMFEGEGAHCEEVEPQGEWEQITGDHTMEEREMFEGVYADGEEEEAHDDVDQMAEHMTEELERIGASHEEAMERGEVENMTEDQLMEEKKKFEGEDVGCEDVESHRGGITMEATTGIQMAVGGSHHLKESPGCLEEEVVRGAEDEGQSLDTADASESRRELELQHASASRSVEYASADRLSGAQDEVESMTPQDEQVAEEPSVGEGTCADSRVPRGVLHGDGAPPVSANGENPLRSREAGLIFDGKTNETRRRIADLMVRLDAQMVRGQPQEEPLGAPGGHGGRVADAAADASLRARSHREAAESEARRQREAVAAYIRREELAAQTRGSHRDPSVPHPSRGGRPPREVPRAAACGEAGDHRPSAAADASESDAPRLDERQRLDEAAAQARPSRPSVRGVPSRADSPRLYHSCEWPPPGSGSRASGWRAARVFAHSPRCQRIESSAAAAKPPSKRKLCSATVWSSGDWLCSAAPLPCALIQTLLLNEGG
ncbi:hypothetical protein AB1Y20_007557 [Prymnesium parvum]|uniref:Fibronectin type-III domain-containing protein n=1 Tax=Prymnesium parvum TaxID=97485 RepID=A0AB34IY00_PRYPA